MSRKSIISVLLSALLLFGTLSQTYAQTTKEKIADIKAKQQQNQSSLTQTQEKIHELETKKGESETYLAELDRQMGELVSELEHLQKEYDVKQEELVVLQDELVQAKLDEEEQYEAMKLRIQYMYERSTNNYLSMLFESGSVTEFLNQAESISKMTAYDRKALEEYRKIKEEIEEKEAAVAHEKDEIAVLQKEGEDKQAAVSLLLESTYNQIREYKEDISEQESEQSYLLKKINEQEETMNKLLRQAKEEEAAAKKAAEEAARKEAERKQAEYDAQKKNNTSSNQSTSNSSSSVTSGNSSSNTVETNSSSSSGTYLGRFKITAYCNCSRCCGKWAGGATASGVYPTEGRTIAMGGVPFGTKLMINGIVYVVEDRGTAYGHIDMYKSSHSSALAFGLKYADVYQVN